MSFLLKYAWRVRQLAANQCTLAELFDGTPVLIPVPGSAPRLEGTRWPAERLAAAFVREGLGRFSWTGLHRVRAVRKSATSSPHERPTIETHYASFAVDSSTVLAERIVLIDDVVTKGRTLIAAASRVQEAFPNARVRAFALVRTMGLVSGVNQLLEPCLGEITWRHGDAHRNP